MVAENRFDCFCVFLSAVERHLREKVVRSMSITNVMVKGVVNAMFNIDRAQSIADKVEFLWALVRNSWVRVLQKGYESKPHVDDHARAYIVPKDTGEPKHVLKCTQKTKRCSYANF